MLRRMGMTKGRAFAILMLLAGSVGGYLLAVAYPSQHGQPHGCPYGAPASSCFFPADLHDQRIAWSVGGGLCALLLVGLIFGALNVRRVLRDE